MPTDLHSFGNRQSGPTSLLAAFAALGAGTTALRVFETQEIQQPNYNGLPHSAAETRQPIEHPLLPGRLPTWHELLPTPPLVRDQLSPRQVGFWQLASQLVWAVSTQHYTALLTPATPPLVELVTIRPAKGGGEMRLYVGQLALYDAYRSTAFGLLGATIGGVTGIFIKQRTSYDC